MSNNTRLSNESWESLMRVHSLAMRGFEQDRSWGDLSMREYDVLYTLDKSNASLNMSELNCQVLLSQPALSRLVDRLAVQGLLEKTHDEADARSVRVRLTAAGKDVRTSIGRRHARDVNRVMNTLDTEEITTLQRLCNKLIYAIQQKETSSD